MGRVDGRGIVMEEILTVARLKHKLDSLDKNYRNERANLLFALRRAIKVANAAGYSYSYIGKQLGLTKQRVHQLAESHR